jgi:hypothetical protein
MTLGRRIATVLLGGLLLFEVGAVIFNATTQPAVFQSLGLWRWPAVAALALLLLGWAILVFRGSLFFTWSVVAVLIVAWGCFSYG